MSSDIIENGIEWKVIKAAFKCKNYNKDFNIDRFFKNFFNCHDAITLARQDGTIELQDNKVYISCKCAHIIKVITRDVDSHRGRNLSSVLRYDPDTDQVFISNVQCLRVKMSHELLCFS